MEKLQEADENVEFRSDILPRLLRLVNIGLYYIEESLFGTSCKPKYSTGEEFDREHFEANLSSKTIS